MKSMRLGLNLLLSGVLLSGLSHATERPFPTSGDAFSWVDGALIYPNISFDDIDISRSNRLKRLPFPSETTFKLHSNPGADVVIYIDVDGYEEGIGSHAIQDPFRGREPASEAISTPFDLDGNPLNFNDEERKRIQQIWLELAAFYASFNIDVTTEEPVADAFIRTSAEDLQFGVRVLAGGELFDPLINSGSRDFENLRALIKNKRTDLNPAEYILADHNPTYGAESIPDKRGAGHVLLHEIGHTMGLGHLNATKLFYGPIDGRDIRGATGTSSETAWRTVMGSGGSIRLTQNLLWDVRNHLENGLTYRKDDHANVLVDASELRAQGGELREYGIIEQQADRDVFQFTLTEDSYIDLTVSPPIWSASLDVYAKLHDVNGKTIASSNPQAHIEAYFHQSLPAGKYYISVQGAGKKGRAMPGTQGVNLGYDDYASTGEYVVALSSREDNNQSPIVQDLYAVIERNTSLLFEPLELATDPQGQTMSLTHVGHTGADFYTAEINADGTMTYQSNNKYGRFFGDESFNYSVTDSDGNTSTASVFIDVLSSVPTNGLLVQADDIYTTSEQLVRFNPRRNDMPSNGKLVMTVAPVNGSLQLLNAGNGDFEYRSVPNFVGVDTFKYKMINGAEESAATTVTVTVLPSYGLLANDDNKTALEDIPHRSEPLGNDTILTDDWQLSIVTPPTNGSLEIGFDHTFTYLGDKDFHGTDHVVYRLSNSAGFSEATLTYTVAAVEDLPTSQADTFTTPFETPLVIKTRKVTNNDYDADTANLSIDGVSPAQHGSVHYAVNEPITYTPNPGFCGPDTFNYSLVGYPGSGVGDVLVNVECINDDSPNAFTLTTQTDLSPLQKVTSNTIVLGDVNIGVNVSASQGGKILFNGQEYNSVNLMEGDSFAVVAESAEEGQQKIIAVSVGTFEVDWLIKTKLSRYPS